MDPVLEDVLLAQDAERREQQGDRHPGRQGRGHMANRPRPGGTDDHHRAREAQPALGQSCVVDEVHVERAPGGGGIVHESVDEGREADRDESDAQARQPGRQIPRIRSFDGPVHLATPA